MIDPLSLGFLGLICFGAGVSFGIAVERTARAAADAAEEKGAQSRRELERMWRISK